jgi:glycosyltransferase involved in cell wall biosynthesis
MSSIPATQVDRCGAPLRVLVVTGNAIVGGMETAVLRLVERLPPSTFSITALCPFESEFTAQLRELGIPVHVAAIRDRLRWHAIQFAVELVRELDIEVIHAHMPPAHAVAGLAGSATRTPVLATIHSMHLSMQDLEIHRLAGTHLCVVSEAARAHALGVGAVASRLSVIRNGVDSEQFVPAATLPRDAEPLRVGYVGRLSPEKNPALFLNAAALVRASVPSARFSVIGDGPMRRDLEVLARTLRIADAVTFKGECAGMPAQYRALDLLVSTSWHEGTPLAVLEAMASGLPIVATDVGGVPELVVAGTSGLLAPPGDEFSVAQCIVALLRDKDLRQRLGTAARARAIGHFSMHDQVTRTAALLTDVAQRAAPAAGGAMPALHELARAEMPVH